MGKKLSENWPGIGKNIIGPKRALNSQENQFLRLKRAKMPKTWAKNKLKTVLLYDQKLANLNVLENFPKMPNTSWKIFVFI